MVECGVVTVPDDKGVTFGKDMNLNEVRKVVAAGWVVGEVGADAALGVC